MARNCRSKHQWRSEIGTTGRVAGKAASGLLLTLGVGFFLLNVFGGVVSGIWLAIKGEWWTIVWGFAVSFSMPFWWSIITLPSFGLLGLTMESFERGHRVEGTVCALFGGLFDSLVLTLWVVAIFFAFAGRVSEGTLVPMTIWGYSVAIAPLVYMASKERPVSIGSGIGTLVAMIGYILLVILSLCGVGFRPSLIVLAAIAVVKTVLMLPLLLP